MTDPAQSAPSAESDAEKCAKDVLWGGDHRGLGRHESGARKIREFAEAYAALRTAQQSLQNEELLSAYRARQKYLEDTIAELETKHENIVKMQAGMFREKTDELKARTAQLEKRIKNQRKELEQKNLTAFLSKNPEQLAAALKDTHTSEVVFVAALVESERRAETAESALRQIVSFLEIMNARGGLGLDVHKRIDELLTVAAQTPEEK